MTPTLSPVAVPPSFWKTVGLLLGASRRRATGRRRRAQELLQQRSGKSATDWSALGTFFAVLFMVAINVCGAFLLRGMVEAAERSHARMDEDARPHIRTFIEGSMRHPQIRVVVSDPFLAATRKALKAPENFWRAAEDAVPDTVYAAESLHIAARDGITPEAARKALRNGLHNQGLQAFIGEEEAGPPPSRPKPSATALSRSISRYTDTARLAPMLGSIVLFFWIAMLVFQGEGLEVDLQRRRHPMWEWLFSHPAPPGAIFLSEVLAPLAANPIYWGAPLFVAVTYGYVYGPARGALAALLAGVPIAIATACLGKAIEIAVMLRVSPRSRGAIIGLMGWLGYAATMLLFLGLFILPQIAADATKMLLWFTVLPWPYLRWFLGGYRDGSGSFPLGILTCLLAACAMAAAAVRFSVWGAQQGLAGNFPSDLQPAGPGRPVTFGRDPLYRKELLWFSRDRSAIVQTILVPITVASTQLFNLRYFVSHAQEAWNYLCGAAILFGTYFLWVLGPKSLASEGTALWIAQTWPRGLEDLLKAKAWLWSMISTGIVALVLLYAAILFPGEIWKIALVGAGWFLFGRSMAEKSVTLVTVQSASGEIEKVPSGRRWAAQLGMLTFSIGVLTQQWHIAVMGIVYSWITAAAIWQNFRARLPFLYDPWSETLPQPPTLMHAMIAISILVEGGAVVAGILLPVVGRDNIAIAQAIGYSVCAVIVAIGTASFLDGRGVPMREVLHWPAIPDPEQESPAGRFLGRMERSLIPALLAGALGGLLLGLFAHGYLALLEHIPAAAEILHASREQMAKLPGLRQSYFVSAVFFAPFAEEYLFRGLLFRALDREWSGQWDGWRAILGSAAFFAIYHGPLSWIPVGLLGVANALLFKKTGRLAPAVLLHLVYNAVVLG